MLGNWRRQVMERPLIVIIFSLDLGPEAASGLVFLTFDLLIRKEGFGTVQKRLTIDQPRIGPSHNPTLYACLYDPGGQL
jgi:hypothetical protein